MTAKTFQNILLTKGNLLLAANRRLQRSSFRVEIPLPYCNALRFAVQKLEPRSTAKLDLDYTPLVGNGKCCCAVSCRAPDLLRLDAPRNPSYSCAGGASERFARIPQSRTETELMQFTIFDTPWGSFGFVSRGTRLVATYLPRSSKSLHRLIGQEWPQAIEVADALPRFQQEVFNYFSGKPTSFDVRIDLAGVSPFRRTVLEVCLKVPYGKTASYADLARAAGNPAAMRAAGGAMANNPIPLVIPCHRVLRSNGSIGGFSSPRGVAQKIRLLELEGVRLDADPARKSRRRGEDVRTTRAQMRRAG